MRRSVFVAVLFSALQLTAAEAQQFKDPGDLIPGSGRGVRDNTINYPTMRFPLERGPAYANSQVYNPGGMHGGGGGQCEGSNYNYPWRDNFCETRSRATPRCPSARGHQGQDIRPATCRADTHWAVAAADGVIVNVGSYSVTLQTPAGTMFRYLHLNMVRLNVRLLDRVRRGQRIGYVSNHFGGTPTTIHLHFEILDTVTSGSRRATVFMPPYADLVHSYKKLLAGTP
jgi:murein DD-endopeptidase MepM/ murein hydrolase activator NlpD